MRSEAERVAADQVGEDRDDAHFVVFKIADGSFGFRLDDVSEIVRMPGVAHMPLAPRSLLGLANFRGAVLPVVTLRRLLGLPDARLRRRNPGDRDRSWCPAWICGRSDRRTSDATLRTGSGKGRRRSGRRRSSASGRRHKGRRRRKHHQNIESGAACCATSFPGSASPAASAARVSVAATISGPAGRAPQRQGIFGQFRTWDNQEYALPLDRVREIIPLPDQVSEVPRSETAVLGRRDVARPPVAAGLIARAVGIAERLSAARTRQGRGAVDGERCRRHCGGSHPGNPPRRSRADRPGAGFADARRRGRGNHLDLPA